MHKYLRQAIESNQEDGYLKYHAPRYDYLLDLLHRYFTGEEDILEIGRTSFTGIISRSLGASIDTLGFEADGETEAGHHYQFDLNDAQYREAWREDLPGYDIIVFAEVIEHLYTSPERVLNFLKSLLKERGIIIIQTPNAVALHKRIKMMLGKNPYHLIPEKRDGANHYREYTADELANYCRAAGFSVEEQIFKNYFDYRYRNHGLGPTNYSAKTRRYYLLNLLFDLLPSSLRPGLCFVIRAE
ncbi:2-polyprenyl-3-methyl-5-hydroxy-6-metoxy-1,4-benzoquinol methylase [Fodinibius roseus]|uniref:2-polyprenyl-3-methyl-5-hydroxy-6-metoxy-1,4-benzoquinol methylase n=1 Tax=Fodinibius roseus TaxID=1194090 RepID=A0A1M5CUV1_9BACT|nr:2-polyprenyl-3-methyl-5-hydroxy-6-metoxy-1,4-benzoquinol methylase [Fodinibius roseus]